MGVSLGVTGVGEGLGVWGREQPVVFTLTFTLSREGGG